eukprot:gb/GEZN01000002.1/.p1 GENE.gb/GEZN01000002.1/~~gb/GEZN01000002.1/.p1  ORF type:complete len:6816 (+),score=1425.09 gb/GEZN01000002.1/:114-20561(+)
MKKKKKKKKHFWDRDSDDGYYSKWYKEYINEYTITMDLKLLDEVPRTGMSLFQTSLVYAEEAAGKKKVLRQSEGECMVNGAGGIGTFGKYGDISKHRLSPGKWQRVVVTVKCVATGKGEVHAYLDTHSLGVAKKELITTDGRFAIDPDALYLFSSSKADLMPGGVALRLVRVQRGFVTDKDVKQSRAMDKFISVFTEQREEEIDEQRKSLTLSSCFAKPRPVWMAPALIATFGDAFIEGTIFEGSSCLAWSFTVLNFALQKTLKEQSVFVERLDSETRGGISDVLYVLDQSSVIFKQFARLLKHPNSGQLMSFLRRVHKLIEALNPGEAAVLPALVEGSELMFILERSSPGAYKMVVVQTDPTGGLRHHAVSAAEAPPKIKFRTCMVIDGIPKKNATDDVFWMAVYNLAIHKHEGDMDRFYTILLPFLANKPLETLLVEAEKAAIAREDAKAEEEADSDAAGNQFGRSFGDWRSPQRSSTAYVRCVLHGLQFMLRSRGLTSLQCKRVLLALRVQFVLMIKHDMDFVFPDDNGQRVCDMACSQLSFSTVKLAAKLEEDIKQSKTGTNKEQVLSTIELNAARLLVEEVRAKLDACANKTIEMPPRLELTRENKATDNNRVAVTEPSAPITSEFSQFMHAVAWEDEHNVPDPGQAVFLRKYQAIDLLQIPQKARTRVEAVRALRLCDRLCSLMENQVHCVKNDKFLILSLLEHILTQVVPVPKPRGVGGSKDLSAAAKLKQRMERRKRREERRSKKKAEQDKQRKEAARKAKLAKQGLLSPDSKAKAETKAAEDDDVDEGKEAAYDDDSDQERDEAADDQDEPEKPKKKYKKKKPEKEDDEKKVVSPKGQDEGQDDDQPNFTVGQKVEDDLSQESCIWDQPMTYHLQVELLLTLQRLSEHFAAAVGSIQMSRALDAVCLVVPGVICAIADATMRRRASDLPSEVCSHLMGQTRDGVQLGIPGFGLSVATFATQTETMEVHNPELSVARTAVLDYFQSPQQRVLEKIFTWEDNYFLKPGKVLTRYLRNVNRELSAPVPTPYTCLLDNYPMPSLMKEYPELKCYRDITLWWKYWLNTDLTAFPNWTNGGMTSRYTRSSAELRWQWDSRNNAFQVYAFNNSKIIACRPNPQQNDPVTGKRIKNLPKYRYESTATPYFYCALPKIRSEDDVIYRSNLPSFDDEEEAKSTGTRTSNEIKEIIEHGVSVGKNQKKLQKQVLGQYDSELLISYLTVPYLRLPLVLSFFATEDRIHKLASSKLRRILDSVLFEPGRYLAVNRTGVEPVMVPTPHKDLLASPYGLLFNELVRAPDTVLHSVVVLLDAALALDTGSVVDEESDDFNTSVDIILYASRLAARVDNFVSFLVSHSTGTHDCIDAPLRELEVTEDCLTKLRQGQQEIQAKLQQEIHVLLQDYLVRLDRECEKHAMFEDLINRNSRMAADLHAHTLAIFRNVRNMDATAAKTILGSFVYLTTRHTWNKFERSQGRLLMPEHQLYEVLAVQRRRLLRYHGELSQGSLDAVLQEVLQVSSSTTGALRASAEVVDANNKWSRIAGPRSFGRYAVGATRSVGSEESKDAVAEGDASQAVTSGAEGEGGGTASSSMPRGPLKVTRQQSNLHAPVGEVADTGLLGVEMDLQIGQMTLRSRHLSALPTNIASHPDVKMLFGDQTIQASLLEQAEHRIGYRLVGLNHDVQFWQSAHTECPPLGEQWERDYDPSELFPEEQWVARIFEPVRKAFFDGPNPPPMQFMLPEKALPEEAEVAVLLGLHQQLGGPWKLIYVFRRLKCIHVYECVSHGRQWWWTLHLATDVRYSMKMGQPFSGSRRAPFPSWWQRGFGKPYPIAPTTALADDITLNPKNRMPTQSVVVLRNVAHKENLSGGQETLVPSRLLHGLLPSCLLEQYRFWSDESLAPPGARVTRLPGYKRMRGYPKAEDGEHMLLVELEPVGSWMELARSSRRGATKKANVCESTGLPGRTIKVTRVLKNEVQREFKQRQKVAALVESLELLAPPERKERRPELMDELKDEQKNLAPLEEGQAVEAEWQGGKEWHPATIVEAHEEDGTYDVKFTGTSAWIGEEKRMQREFLREVDPKKAQKTQGEGHWHWEGMTDEEDQDWAEEGSSDEDEDDGKEGKHKKLALPFEHFNALAALLRAAGGNEEACFSAMRALVARHDEAKGTSSTFTPLRFTEVYELADKISQHLKSSKSLVLGESKASESSGASRTKPIEAEVLLNLLYAPKRSRLHSLLRCLVRLENASHITAWSKLSPEAAARWFDGGLPENSGSSNELGSVENALSGMVPLGVFPIDKVEFPRLKLAFTARQDDDGETRLYSVDHADLFVTNQRPPLAGKMLAGIPHSLLLSNLQEEMQVLVPVVSPPRPKTLSEPFSTTLVLDRANKLWTEALSARYFLYPVHVSWSFLMTQGLHPSLYLMLLRFLNRDYEEVYRLADSVATDTKFSKEGKMMFDGLGLAGDDFHPDAHACRAKVSLVTMDSGSKAPWDLTLELSRFVVKQPHVTANCRMSLQEELQLLESDGLVLDENPDKPEQKLLPAYVRMLVKNRQYALRARSAASTNGKGEGGAGGVEISAECFTPPRAASRPWLYRMDKTIFGESYATMVPVHDEEQFERERMIEGHGVEPPGDGWLVLVNFQVLWKKECITVQSGLADLPAGFPFVKFLTLQADTLSLSAISRRYKVRDFPTLIILRGETEVGRVVGGQRTVERVVTLLNDTITDADKGAYAERFRRERDASGQANDEAEEEQEEGLLQWTWDLECRGGTLRIEDLGMSVRLVQQEGQTDAVWEWTIDPYSNQWTAFDPTVNTVLETSYLKGDLYRVGQLTWTDQECGTRRSLWRSTIKKKSNEITGMYTSEPGTGRNQHVRRRGDLVSVPFEPQPKPEEEEEIKRLMAQSEQKKRMMEELRKQRIGKDVEAVRGNSPFERMSGERFEWKLQWRHEPSRGGKSDAVGICTEIFEDVGPMPSPGLGGKAGASLALYASGELFFKGEVIATAKVEPRKPIKMEVVPVAEPKTASSDTNDVKEKKAGKDKKEETPAAPKQPVVEKQVAALWGKGDIVTCVLDTSKPNGELSFQVNGKPVPGVTIDEVFSMFGPNVLSVYPAICTCPLIELEAADEVLEDDAEAATTLDAESKQLLEEAKLTGIDPELLRSMDASTRSALVQKAKTAIEAKREFPLVSIVLDESKRLKKESRGEEIVQVEEETDDAIAKKEQAKQMDENELPLDRIRWMHEEQSGWQCYTQAISDKIEEAKRAGKKKISLRVNGEEQEVDFTGTKSKDKGEMTVSGTSAQQPKRVRRHVLTDGFSSNWELMSVKFSPPLSLRGQGALAILNKVWSSGDTMEGQTHGLGFLFLYALLQGQMRCKVVSSGWSFWDFAGRGGTSSDSHRFAILLAQLYTDSRVASVCSSVINILGYNKPLCGRMPPFRDTRKLKQTAIFNGWVDQREPRSPLHTLFSSLTTILRALKKKKGVIKFPPRPPYPELDAPIDKALVGKPIRSDEVTPSSEKGTGGVRPTLTDFGCDERLLVSVEAKQVEDLAVLVGHTLGQTTQRTKPPVTTESPQHFRDLIKEINQEAAKAKGGKKGGGALVVVDFFATWCQPCVALAPIFTRLALMTPVARFIKVDVDECEILAREFKIESMPTVKLLRGGSGPEHVVGTITGGGPQFVVSMNQVLEKVLTSAEQQELLEFVVGQTGSGTVAGYEKGRAALGTLPAMLSALAKAPLRDLNAFCIQQTRAQKGEVPVDARLPFDLLNHETARTAVAKSMLRRMKDDVSEWANVANGRPLPKLQGLLDQTFVGFFKGEAGAEAGLKEGRVKTMTLLNQLRALRDADTSMVQDVIPLLTRAANHVMLDPGLGGEGDATEAAGGATEQKLKFLLRRQCGQEPVIWLQFLFSSLLSSRSEADLRRLNPYLSSEVTTLLLELVTVVVFRSNRVGHANRCIGNATRLLQLVDRALALPEEARRKSMERSLPSLIQAADALAQNVMAKRHYVKERGGKKAELVFDPRFLIFEFTWNLLLRKKQVEIVDNFVATLRTGRSMVKQMIMGAGKTTVVAPLLALILADGKSLVLSVVPRALLEMSRKRMRETFATIMQKRIYTLNFERSTMVSRSLHQSLENAIRNRGIVVATPTSVKSIMLSFVETLGNLRKAKESAAVDGRRLKQLELQATELAKVLQTFREGVMLLDEVDLILHPLKSELNFPMGEKDDLDVSQQGERWGLPIHLMDAIFFAETGQVSTVEGRGAALEVLKKLAQLLKDGYDCKALQRLPHITLLNLDFYQEKIKPIMAEWTYLWLLQHHLHGISRQEALRYLLEGAATRSAAASAVQLLGQAIQGSKEALGMEHSDGEPESKSRTEEKRSQFDQHYLEFLRGEEREAWLQEKLVLRRMQTAELLADVEQKSLRLKELDIMGRLQAAAGIQDERIQAIYSLEEQQDKRARAAGTALGHLQERIMATNKEIELLQFPRDDSLDNSIIVWVATAFSRLGSGAGEDGGGASETDLNSVHSLCTRLEDSGYTVRRCDTAEEGYSRALDLAKKGQLRCVLVAGGGDQGCGPSCNRRHPETGVPCRKCWNNFNSHTQHMCPNKNPPQRGFFPDAQYNETTDRNLGIEAANQLLTGRLSLKVRFPPERICFYATESMLPETHRLAYWRHKVVVVGEGKELLDFVQQQQPWETEEERAKREQEALDAALAEAEEQRRKKEAAAKAEKEKSKAARAAVRAAGGTTVDMGETDEDEEAPALMKPPSLRRQVSVGTTKLQTLQQRLADLESEKAEAMDAEEAEHSKMQAQIKTCHSELVASIDAQLDLLRKVAEVAEAAASPLKTEGTSQIEKPREPSPGSLRDAGRALAWLEVQADTSLTEATKPEAVVALIKAVARHPAGQEAVVKLIRCAARLREACVFLEQTALAAKVMACVALQPKKLLNLAHDWLRTFLPHCLSKVNRVSFGLLDEQQCEEALSISENTPRSRLKLAVPFVGKDVPSTSSEFAHPDVIIGLSVLAYRYNGLRRPDFDDMVDTLTSDFSREIGPSRERASSRRHETWVLEAGGTIRGIKAPLKGLNLSVAAIKTVVQQAFEKEDEQKKLQNQPKKKKEDGKDGEEEKEEDPGAKEVVQLKYLQKSNEEQMSKLYLLWKSCPQVIHHYLNRFIFPAYMRSQRVKISASGQAVGGDMLIGRRVGFSGTPSDLLPKEMGECDYETGDDGKMLSTVLDPSITSSDHLPSSWDVQYLLTRIANARSPRFHALIDTGALITGYSNHQVAQELLDRGLAWCDGVVFLDDADKQQVLVRATGRVVPADQCGVPLERRFAFYDQIHTTGMDIRHVVNARAIITLGKDMVFRDYVQGAFRMRGIGAGQTITVYIIPEVAELIDRELKAASRPDQEAVLELDPARRTLTSVAAWLVVNSMRSEQVQWNMLCVQNVSNIYRKNAYRAIHHAVRQSTAFVSKSSSALVPLGAMEEPAAELEISPALAPTDSKEDSKEESKEEKKQDAAATTPTRKSARLKKATDPQGDAVAASNDQSKEPKTKKKKKTSKKKKSIKKKKKFGSKSASASPEKETKSAAASPEKEEIKEQLGKAVAAAMSSSSASPAALAPSDTLELGLIEKLDPLRALTVFDEPIDFSLEAGVPDLVPFKDKLLQMLDAHTEFILQAQEAEVARKVLEEVGQNTLLDDGPKRLDTEQEREQEQEQQKEVQARRDQQIEVEKFVDREYSRVEESPKPWHVSMLKRGPHDDLRNVKDEHPFYSLSQFKLRYQEPLKFPAYLYLSRNYFNPQWSGLRRVKNVVMLLEWTYDTGGLRLLAPGEEGSCTSTSLTRVQDEALQKAFSFLRHHAQASGHSEHAKCLTRLDVANAIKAVTDREVPEPVLSSLLRDFGEGERMTLNGLRSMLLSGRLRQEESGRFFVAVSLAEAETLRRILHLHPKSHPVSGPGGNKVQFALRYTPMASLKIPGTAASGSRSIGDGGGVIFDASYGWRRGTAGVTQVQPYQLSVAYNSFKFFNCDMHYLDPALNVLVWALQLNTPYQREMFFTSTIGCRRRMARKWQETPLSKVLSVVDEWALLKQRAHAIFLREAVVTRQLTLWEAFTLFDADNNGHLTPAEFYGAIKFLQVPGVTAEDVIDLLESADRNRDGVLDYREFLELLSGPGEKDEEDEEETDEKSGGKEGEDERALPPKVEPYGSEELRVVLVQRKKQELQFQREEKLRRQAYQQVLDRKLFEEELKASAARKGGANPKVYDLRYGTWAKDLAAEAAASAGAAAPDGGVDQTLVPGGAGAFYQKLFGSKGGTSAVESKQAAEGKGESGLRFIRTVEFQFTHARGPLRMVPQGNVKFPQLLASAMAGDSKGTASAEMMCPQGHALKAQRRSWYQCSICHKMDTYHECNEMSAKGVHCYYRVCLRCYEKFNEREEQKRVRFFDKSTYVQCGGGCSLSVQIPVFSEAPASEDEAGSVSKVVDVVQCDKFTLTVELLLEKLPPPGHLGTLFRFAPASLARARARHRASVYINSLGEVGDPEELAPQEGVIEEPIGTKEEKSEMGRLKPGIWQVVTVVVDAPAGEMSSYVDGQLCRASTGLDPTHLRLKHQLTVLGGGKVAHARGGCIRRLLLHDVKLNESEVGEALQLCRRSLLGKPVVLLVDCGAPGAVGPADASPALQNLAGPLQDSISSLCRSRPHRDAEVVVLTGPDAAPDTVKNAAQRFVKDNRFHIAVVSLQSRVWAAGLNTLQTLIEDGKNSKQHHTLVAYVDKVLTAEQEEKLSTLSIQQVSNLEQLADVFDKAIPPQATGALLLALTPSAAKKIEKGAKKLTKQAESKKVVKAEKPLTG